MIAMQYSFTLPADYDMAIIEQRIAEKGRLMDGFPHLAFKAYLSARALHGNAAFPENLYAPFYLWHQPEGMNAFLGGPGFAALTESFGWPSVKLWSVWAAPLSARLSAARFATRHLDTIHPYTRLDALRATETALAHDCVDRQQAVAAVVAFEPITWTLVRLRLWEEPPSPAHAAGGQVYDVGHVSVGDKR